MPAGDTRLLEVLFYNGGLLGGIYVAQDAILGPDEVRMGIEARVEKSDVDPAPCKVRVGMHTDRRGQELFLVARIHRERYE